MQTNRRIPALVCLSMIVSGCANQDLFDNWNNADMSQPVHPDQRATDMAPCSANCPFTWTEDFSGGLFLRSEIPSSVWKTVNATWVFEHTRSPEDKSSPEVSWALCSRDSHNPKDCTSPLTAGMLSVVSFGGSLSRAFSASAYFHNPTNLSNIQIELTFTNISCDKVSDVCNLDNNPISNGRAFLIITTVPKNTELKRYRCTSTKCAAMENGSTTANPEIVQGIQIRYDKIPDTATYQYLNITFSKLAITGIAH
jgi:hypothetical protein